MSLVPDNPDIPEEYLCEIGRLVVNWNRLESALNHTLIITLLGGFATDGRALSVFAHMAFQQKLDVLNTMLRIVDEDIAAAYRERVQGLMKQAQEQRNATLHQSWFSQEDGVKRFDISARGKLKITMALVPLQVLKDAARAIDEAHSKLMIVVALPISSKNDVQ
jgi:hypothetical protein